MRGQKVLGDISGKRYARESFIAGSSQREFLNLLRFLGNELRLPLVGIGTKEAYLAIRTDDQLENRFEPMVLPAWQEGKELESLLASFVAILPLPPIKHRIEDLYFANHRPLKRAHIQPAFLFLFRHPPASHKRPVM